MKTIKLIGSGPLAGMVCYGTVAHMDPCSEDGVCLELDVQEKLGERSFSRVTISAKSGATVVNQYSESDIITASGNDLAFLRESRERWMFGERRLMADMQQAA